MSDKPLACPKCGGTDLTLLFDEERYTRTGVLLLPQQKVIRTYRCKCGMSFTTMDDPPPRDPAPS